MRANITNDKHYVT